MIAGIFGDFFLVTVSWETKHEKASKNSGISRRIIRETMRDEKSKNSGNGRSATSGEKLEGRLLKGSFDKACALTCRFFCRSPPHPPPSPPPPPFPLFFTGKPSPHHPPEPDPETLPRGTPIGTAIPFRKNNVIQCNNYRSNGNQKPLNALFLMGCFPMDVQHIKRPLRTRSGKLPIKVGKQPINVGERPIKARVLVGISVGCLMGCFWAPPPWRKTAPLKRPIKRSMR